MSDLYRDIHDAEAIVEWLVHHGNRHTIYPPDASGVCRDEEKFHREAVMFYAPLARVIAEARRTRRVKVYRAIKVPHTRHIEWSNIGCCWSYEESSAQPIFGPQFRESTLTVRFFGIVAADDVDWEQTFKLHEEHGAEQEARLEPGTIIELYRIDTRRWHREGLSHRAEPWVSRPFKKTLRAQVHEGQYDEAWRGRK